MYKENDQLRGIYVEIIREACKRVNAEAEFHQYPWKRCVRYMKKGKADAIFPPIRTEERTKFLYFPEEPMTVKKIAVFSLKKRGMKLEKLDGLKGKVVGVNQGYSYGTEFDSYQGLKKDYSKNIHMQVKKLLHERMDVAVAVEAPFRFFIKKLGLADKIETTYIISQVSSYVAFSKAIGERGRLLSEKFSQALSKLKKEGVVQKIEDSYLK